MSDKTGSGSSGAPFAPSDTSPVGKRPHAMLDLKAKEINVTPIVVKTRVTMNVAEAVADNAAKSTPRRETSSFPPVTKETVTVMRNPGDDTHTDDNGAKSTVEMQPTAVRPPDVVIKKRGGFFSHLVASLVGAGLALTGAEWILPRVETQFGVKSASSRLQETTAALESRLALVEAQKGVTETKTDPALEARLADLEKTAAQIPAISEAQSRLVAETKAALAADASNSGATDQIVRLEVLETKLKALSDAGVNDPNSGRLEQLAGLTGKVADLETSLSTQLTALRKSVSEDVEARLVAATESSEAAKSGAQRIDKDVTALKSDTVRVEERVVVLKGELDKIAAGVKLSQEGVDALRSDVEAAKAASTQAADAAGKVAGLNDTVQTLLKSEAERQANAERMTTGLQLQSLKRAIAAGGGFASELSDVKARTGSGIDLSALEPFKDSGVPGVGDLVKTFRPIANAAIETGSGPADGSVVDKLLSSAKSVIKIRRTNHAPDDRSTEAIIGRMELALKDQRFADVVKEAETLPPEVKPVVKPVVDQVQARVAVETAIAAVEQKLKVSLGAPAQPVSN